MCIQLTTHNKILTNRHYTNGLMWKIDDTSCWSYWKGYWRKQWKIDTSCWIILKRMLKKTATNWHILLIILKRTNLTIIDFVLHNDLQNHGGKPHTPNWTLLKMVMTITTFGPLLFPINTNDQVVPAFLHIHLGVTLLGYNLMNDECKAVNREQRMTKMLGYRHLWHILKLWAN